MTATPGGATARRKPGPRVGVRQQRLPRPDDLHFGTFPDLTDCGALRKRVKRMTTDILKWEAEPVKKRCKLCWREMSAREEAGVSCA